MLRGLSTHLYQSNNKQDFINTDSVDALTVQRAHAALKVKIKSTRGQEDTEIVCKPVIMAHQSAKPK